jgi:hypothetical protein
MIELFGLGADAVGPEAEAMLKRVIKLRKLKPLSAVPAQQPQQGQQQARGREEGLQEGVPPEGASAAATDATPSAR